MAHTSTTITAPVNTDDVSAVLGVASHDVATLCMSANINRFAKWKPVRYEKWADLTEAERRSVGFGIAFGYIASATSAAVNLLANLQSAIPSAPAWGYNRVRPGTDISRLTDFLNSNNVASPGYNHNAKAPLSGFSDITLFQSEFGLESKVYSFNMKWGASSNQGSNDTSGIEIPLNELMSSITDGTWRLGLLICFPSSGKYKIAAASAPSAIVASPSQPGDMMIRPAGTGQLKKLFSDTFNAGVRSVTAIPFIANGISRGGTGDGDMWQFTANAQIMAMPNGEKITINLVARFANVTVTFHEVKIEYLDYGNNVKQTYTLYPTTGSGLSETSLAKPSAVGGTRCRLTLDFTMSGQMASSDSVSLGRLHIGLQNILIDAAASKLEKYSGSAWSSVSQISSLGGRYRITDTDAARTSGRSSIMDTIENLPRSANRDNPIHPTVSLDSNKFNSGNYFIHKG